MPPQTAASTSNQTWLFPKCRILTSALSASVKHLRSAVPPSPLGQGSPGLGTHPSIRTELPQSLPVLAGPRMSPLTPLPSRTLSSLIPPHSPQLRETNRIRSPLSKLRSRGRHSVTPMATAPSGLGAEFQGKAYLSLQVPLGTGLAHSEGSALAHRRLSSVARNHTCHCHLLNTKYLC